MRQNNRFGNFRSAVVLTGILSCAGFAAAQAKAMPDAQVEASVLKALAAAPDLANQQISTTTVYGVVTLSGSVRDEASRTKAETIASRVQGVQKVVDELTLGDTSSAPTPGAATLSDVQGSNPNLQSDGTMATPPPAAPIEKGSVSPDNQQNIPYPAANGNSPSYGPGAPEYRQPYSPQQGQYPQQQGPYSQQQGQYPQQSASQGQYPPQPGYPQSQQPYNGQQQPYPGQQQPYQSQQPYPGQPQQPFGGQQGGETVMIPAGSMIRIRINQTLDSGRTKAGDTFNGIVVNDVVAEGVVAIPRGASISGTVVAATKSGDLTGRGELSLQLTQVTLGGKTFPVSSDLWDHHGGDKTIETVNKTAIGGGIGALIGAAAGGGAGAAIGAGVGGALGLGSSAASGRGQVYIPSEGLLTFKIAQPTQVVTVSQSEMDRLGYGVPNGAAQAQQVRRRYPAPYYGPAYYPSYPYPY